MERERERERETERQTDRQTQRYMGKKTMLTSGDRTMTSESH